VSPADRRAVPVTGSAGSSSGLAAAFLRSGKVRDLFAIDDARLLLVATDRISAFDVILPTAIPDKGRGSGSRRRRHSSRTTCCRRIPRICRAAGWRTTRPPICTAG
jgi:hypothetical protein